MKPNTLSFLVTLALAGSAWATSPYDMPYGIQWNFIIGNVNADAPYHCQVSPDGTVWMTNGGTALNTPTMTWGSPNSVYNAASACSLM